MELENSLLQSFAVADFVENMRCMEHGCPRTVADYVFVPGRHINLYLLCLLKLFAVYLVAHHTLV